MEQLKTFEDIAVLAATSLKEVVEKHGADAVNLGLMVYRVEAIQHIAVGLLGLALLILTWVFIVKIYIGKIMPWVAKGGYYDSREIIHFPAAIFPAIVGAFGLAASFNLFSFYHWAAVFGYPEILIAYKALSAAGLV